MIEMVIPGAAGLPAGGAYRATLEALFEVEAWSEDERVRRYVEALEGFDRSHDELEADAHEMPRSVLTFVLCDAYRGTLPPFDGLEPPTG